MNASALCLLAVLASASADSAPALLDPSVVFDRPVVRAQSPENFEYPQPYPGAPQSTITNAPPQQPYSILPDGGFMNPFDPNAAFVDPFAQQGVVGPQDGVVPRVNGPQPYRPGWTSRYSAAMLPKERTEGDFGHVSITEFDFEWEHVAPSRSNWIFSFTQEYWLRLLEGPDTPAGGTTALPGDLHHVGWDFEWATAANGPVSLVLGFNPSFNTDFEQSMTHDAWNWDGRGMIFLPTSPNVTWVLGAGYWDRVDDITVPYAGVIWLPNERAEYRLVLPEPRISYFVGTPWGVAAWFYVRGEYHVESYELEVQTTTSQDQVQFEDFRALIGFRSEGAMAAFIEGGWVFNREVKFEDDTPGFDIDDGFIGRVGLSY